MIASVPTNRTAASEDKITLRIEFSFWFGIHPSLRDLSVRLDSQPFSGVGQDSDSPLRGCRSGVRKDLLATQVAVVVLNAAAAIVEVPQAGIAPAAVSLLTGCFQPAAVDANVPASLLITARRDAATPSAATIAASVRAAEVPVVVDDRPAAVAVIQRRIMPLAVPLLAGCIQTVS